MKVKELIEELKEYNPDAEVVTSYTETIELSYSGSWEELGESDKMRTPFVFIDGCDYDEEDD